jgi:DNA polymerase-3 subunit epsilon
MDLKHEEMAKALEATGDYRVLRRRPPFQPLPVAGETTTLAMVIDVETTGLDTDRAEIIELGIVPFRYTAERIVEVLPAFSRFNEPASPITEEISRITGITKEMVAGHRIDPRQVAEVVDPCSFVIAHNAGFDRRVAERHFPALAAKPWACSVEEIG